MFETALLVAVLAALLLLVGVYLAVFHESVGLLGLIMIIGAFFLATWTFPSYAERITSHDDWSESVASAGMLMTKLTPIISIVLAIVSGLLTWGLFDTRNVIDVTHLRLANTPMPAAPGAAVPPPPATGATQQQTDDYAAYQLRVAAYNQGVAQRSQVVQGFGALGLTIFLTIYAYSAWHDQPNQSIMDLVQIAKRHDAVSKGPAQFKPFYESHGRLRAGITLHENFIADSVETFTDVIKAKVEKLPETSKWKGLVVEKILKADFLSADGKTWTHVKIYYSGKLPADPAKGRAAEVVIKEGFVRVKNPQKASKTTDRNEKIIAQINAEIPHSNGSDDDVDVSGITGGVDLFPNTDGDFGINE